MGKERTPIPDTTAADVEYQHDRTCCVCRERGRPTQIHHIDENPANHATENLAVLCLSCHDQTQLRGSFSRKLRPEVVRRYHEEWIELVRRVRARSEELLSLGVKKVDYAPKSFMDPGCTLGEQPELARYLDSLPELLVAAVQSSKDRFDSGATQEMVEAAYDIIGILRGIWLRLARFYPINHFGNSAEKFFSAHMDEQVRWHRLLAEPYGMGSGGTVVRFIVSHAAMEAAANAIEQTALSLLGLGVDGNEANHWLGRWRQAVSLSAS